MLGEEHLAEDVTQDIFMHIHRSLDTYDTARDLRPWVFTIATNKVRDYWRSRRFRDTQRESSIADEDGDLQVESNQRGPVDWLENTELKAMLEEAVESLPEGMRTTLVLRYFEGLSFEAIGTAIDRNEAAVRKRYSRALEELRKRLVRLSETGTPEPDVNREEGS
jgi:RNA polymerase sigma-70 factor (ECF subfamily)